ncbi:MAG: cobalt-precorrin-5B (C(1))-methyltransferase [Nitrospirae bacterium]|nr:cobalt-precorrin-5B (C(1))-methyltransferase [Nitrospirota bacterium]
MPRKLRSGYTTGACAAAAAKAAALAALTGAMPDCVEIPFPDGSRASFPVRAIAMNADAGTAEASVTKDAGDDPDVTNGAEIRASARLFNPDSSELVKIAGGDGGGITVTGGEGVGKITKPGLAIPPGEPAINPVPRRMIREAVSEALAGSNEKRAVEITVSVPRGRELARKTLNERLGIIGGISILGTTGIVRPLSADAWTATITASMSVATAAGIREIVISTGRTSERAAQSALGLPPEAFVMMGDYLEFALMEAARHGFERIHLAAMWAKTVKAALGSAHTHVRHGALEAEALAMLLGEIGSEKALVDELKVANTAREIYDRLSAIGRRDLIRAICLRARQNAEGFAGNAPVSLMLVHHDGSIVEVA